MFEQEAFTAALFGGLLSAVILKAIGGRLSWVNDDYSFANALSRLVIASASVAIYLGVFLQNS